MCQHTDSGETGMSVLSLMCECSIRLHPAIAGLPSARPTDGTKPPRRGGMAPAATITFKRLASLLAEKRQQEYNKTIAWIRCQLSFSLVRSSVMCLRGARSSYHRPARPSPWTWSSQKGTSQRTKELWTLHRQFSLLTFYTLTYVFGLVYVCMRMSVLYVSQKKKVTISA